MASTSSSQPDLITAKWKTAIDSESESFGTVLLNDDLRLRFPSLRSSEEIPAGTSILWGVTDKLRRSTAVTLPFGAHGTVSRREERNYFAESPVTHLFLGDTHILDPGSDFVTEISFTPRPSKDLHIRGLFEFIEPQKDISGVTFKPSCEQRRRSFASAHFAYFESERQPLFEVTLDDPAVTISAWIGGRASFTFEEGTESNISFLLRFAQPRDPDSAIQESLLCCVFLSFLAHQYIYPTDFSVRAADASEFHELHLSGLIRSPSRPDTWVRNTLVLPDQQPEQFSEVFKQWWKTNDRNLRSRFLYRYSLQNPNTYSTERFLNVFQAIEGAVDTSGHRFLEKKELEAAETALRAAFSESAKIEALIGKLRSANTASPKNVLKQELPKIFSASCISPSFDVPEFVERVYERRNKSSHGGAHLEKDPIGALVEDTLLLTAIYLIIECSQLGLDVHHAIEKFHGAWLYRLPFVLQSTSNPNGGECKA
jgi:hypothetical protein